MGNASAVEEIKLDAKDAKAVETALGDADPARLERVSMFQCQLGVALPQLARFVRLTRYGGVARGCGR